MKKRLLCAAIPALLLVLTAFTANATAQFFGGPDLISNQKGIATKGHANLEKLPTKVRMCIDITVKGKNLEDALENLDKQIKKAEKSVDKLKPVKGSIHVGPPRPSTLGNELQKQMGGMGGGFTTTISPIGRKPPRGLKAMQMVTASALFRADWELNEKTAAKQLLFVEELRDEIEKADVSGKKEMQKLSPAEEELMAEAKARQEENYYSSDEDKVEPGTPVFFYIAKLSKDEKKKLYKEAFQKATENAKELADATGMPLGKVISITPVEHAKFSEVYEVYGRGGFGSRQYMENMGVKDSLGENEESSNECRPISFNILIQTVFEIK